MGCGGSKKDASSPAAAQQQEKKPAEPTTAAPATTATAPEPDAAATEPAPTDVATNVRVGHDIETTGKIKGRVLQRTTTDIQLQTEDGGTKWVDIEDIRIVEETENDTAIGATVAIKGTEEQGEIIQRTTTDVKLKLADGTEKWVGVEEIDMVTGAPIYNDVALKASVAVRGCVRGARGQVLQRTSTDVQLQMDDGTEKWFGIEEIDARDTGPSKTMDDSMADQDTTANLEEYSDPRGQSADGDPPVQQSAWCCMGA